jgi:hypothetical protein
MAAVSANVNCAAIGAGFFLAATSSKEACHHSDSEKERSNFDYFCFHFVKPSIYIFVRIRADAVLQMYYTTIFT